MSTINVDTVSPQSGTSVVVSGVEIDAPITSSIAIGSNAMDASTLGDNAVVIGDDAVKVASGITKSVVIGSKAMQNSVLGTTFSVAVGYNAMGGSNSTRTSNGSVAVGYQALFNSNSLSGSNVAVGKDALLSLANASSNTAIGTEAGKAVTTGNSNILVGALAGGALTTGNGNVFIGLASAAFNSGDIFTGSNNIAIGSSSMPSDLTVNNEITLGNSDHTILRCAVTSITSLSDARDKDNIKESPYGLDFVNLLKPVTFDWNTRDGSKVGIKDLGFIAQDLKEVNDENLNLVYEENPEKLEASYGRLIPVLVKAIQDLSRELEILKNK